MATPGSVTDLTSVAQLDDELNKGSTKLTVIDFHATWCGPCHAIAPHYKALAAKYPNVNFFRSDVEDKRVDSLGRRYRVSAMPTFIFLKGQTQVDQVRGARKADIEASIIKHQDASAGVKPFAGTGHTLGSSSPTSGSSSSVPFSGMDPQLKLLLAFVGAYIFFWWLS